MTGEPTRREKAKLFIEALHLGLSKPLTTTTNSLATTKLSTNTTVGKRQAQTCPSQDHVFCGPPYYSKIQYIWL